MILLQNMVKSQQSHQGQSKNFYSFSEMQAITISRQDSEINNEHGIFYNYKILCSALLLLIFFSMSLPVYLMSL